MHNECVSILLSRSQMIKKDNSLGSLNLSNANTDILAARYYLVCGRPVKVNWFSRVFNQQITKFGLQ